MNPEKNLDASAVEEEERIMAEEAVKVLTDAKLLEKGREHALERSRDFSVERYKKQIEMLM